MSINRRSLFSLIPALFLVAAIVLLPLWRGRASNQQPAGDASAKREEAYRMNNLGVALLEQFKYKDGADAFKRALQAEPSLPLAQINLAIALYNVPDLDGALREAKIAAAQSPQSPQPSYTLGLIAKSQNRAEDALAAFQRVLQLDPQDVGANINVGQLYAQQRKYPEAVASFRAALAAEPYNATATYNLATALLRSAQREEGQQLMTRFQKLREGGYGSSIGQTYLEQGRYAEAVASTGAESELIDQATPAGVTYADATADAIDAAEVNASPAAAPSPLAAGGIVTLFDYDGDDRLDLLAALNNKIKLYHNDKGRLTDVTANSALASLPAERNVVAVVAGDYDNDEKPDLFVLNYPGGGQLYHNDGNGKFSERTKDAQIPPYAALAVSAAFVDADHDGDLDVFVAGAADLSASNAAAPNLLLRNNGDGKFSDITTAAQLATPGRTVAVVPTDYDNRRDVDLLLARADAAPVMFRNLRDGTFRDSAAEIGLALKGDVTAAAAGDVNKDNYTDFFFARRGGIGQWALSDARGRYNLSDAPGATADASAAQLLDYDNDGLLDLVFFAKGQLRVLRNVGAAKGQWVDASEAATKASAASAGNASPRSFAAGDIDADGDTDLIELPAAGRLRVWRNEGGNRQRSLRVQLTGKVSNRSGVGAKVEARAGSLRQRAETYAASPAPAPADVEFGLGNRTGVDAVRVLWASGIVQAETEIAGNGGGAPAKAEGKVVAAQNLKVTEVDRKPSSCPFLYAWNGERFEFITDFMGGGEMGYYLAPGVWNYPDPDEYVRLRDDQLKERGGRYELRVTNELEEVLYLDRMRLIAVAHPADTEVYPNEGMTEKPRGYKLYSTRGARPPLAAADHAGRDVTARLRALDRQFVDDLPLHRIRGYAEDHSLTLQLDRDGASAKRAVLFLTGWTDYAFSSDNVAAHQAGLRHQAPALQVKDQSGRWRTVVKDVGVPIGRPQTVVVDLTDKFLSASREVRIVTNMRVYWDQALYDTSGGDAPTRVTALDPVVADLDWRGFSAEIKPRAGDFLTYDYARVSYASPWKSIPGSYTREGDVRKLLAASDDAFVISRPGDQLTLAFDARRLPPLPVGWKRTFLFYGDGFSKEMDINSATPDQVLPLPFHGMRRYPYKSPEEAFPMTETRRRLFENYNTRVVGASLPSIDEAAAGGVNQSRRGANVSSSASIGEK